VASRVAPAKGKGLQRQQLAMLAAGAALAGYLLLVRKPDQPQSTTTPVGNAPIFGAPGEWPVSTPVQPPSASCPAGWYWSATQGRCIKDTSPRPSPSGGPPPPPPPPPPPRESCPDGRPPCGWAGCCAPGTTCQGEAGCVVDGQPPPPPPPPPPPHGCQAGWTPCYGAPGDCCPPGTSCYHNHCVPDAPEMPGQSVQVPSSPVLTGAMH
jgi:hypothetical protein